MNTDNGKTEAGQPIIYGVVRLFLLEENKITTIDIKRTSFNARGATWGEQVIIPPSTTVATIAYLLPINPIYAIVFKWTGIPQNPVIQFTVDSKEQIENNTAIWITWNKSDVINLAITGIRFTNASASVAATASVNIKGWV